MSAAPLKLISSMATREVLGELATRYQRATGQLVTTEAAGGVDVAKRVQLGEAVDIVILASNAIDKLIAEGKVLAGSRVDLVKSGIAIAVREGAPKPEIGTEESVKRVVRAARSLSYSTGPSGAYLEKMFARWGLLDEIRSRIVVPSPGVPVGTLIANGVVELGFQQLSELLNLSGVEVVGPLPSAIQTLTIFSGGVSANSSHPEAAGALLDYLASSATAEVKQGYGMDAV
jgi:molybdate transport system substrate-binding protein